MSQAIQRVDPGALAAQIVIQGDLSSLNDAQLSTYYVQLCASMDLNPSTRPFSLLKLNGKLMMYANKDCSDQLRKRDKVSVTIVGREQIDDLLVVTARATLPDGRFDESIGALPLGKLQGEARANALMKCETKAKRRVTLSICGLGFMDESEVEGAEAADVSNGNGRLSADPHTAPDEPADAGKSEDAVTFMARVQKQLADMKSDVAYCKTWSEMVALRDKLGSHSKQSKLLKEMQDYGPERRIISGHQHKELSKLWQHCDRELTKLEGKLKPPPIEATFTDEPDGANEDEDALDAFAPRAETPDA